MRVIQEYRISDAFLVRSRGKFRFPTNHIRSVGVFRLAILQRFDGSRNIVLFTREILVVVLIQDNKDDQHFFTRKYFVFD